MPDEPNAYEIAVARYRIIREHYVAVRKATQDIINVLEEEWTITERELARYETSPGVPLPQYRPRTPITDTEGPFSEGWEKGVSHET